MRIPTPTLDGPIEQAFRRALHDVESVAVRDYGVDVAQWHAHGRLTCAETREVSGRGIDGVIAPAQRALLNGARQMGDQSRSVGTAKKRNTVGVEIS